MYDHNLLLHHSSFVGSLRRAMSEIFQKDAGPDADYELDEDQEEADQESDEDILDLGRESEELVNEGASNIIPGGSYTMGAADDEASRSGSSARVVQVRLASLINFVDGWFCLWGDISIFQFFPCGFCIFVASLLTSSLLL